MTCRNPSNCQKKPDPRATLCKGCASAKSLADPDVKARRLAQLQKANADKMAWLPPEYREAYEKMRDNGGWSAAEAKQEVLSWARKTA